ncbi:MAG: DUF5655 domain-containing protein [Dehalococcoidia bacterium]|nr:DUF5655 domain-containing protein [Dehalococcoidia bacterium]
MAGDLNRAIERFFDDRTEARTIFDLVRKEIATLGAADLQVTKSQIAFRHGRGFAWAWTPDRYLHGETPPLVLSISLNRADTSPRWKEVVEVPGNHWMHHLELRNASEVDDDVLRWLREAWGLAG